MEAPTKKAKKDGLKMKDEQGSKHMPYMKSVESISHLWTLWEVGQPEQEIGPISMLADRTRRERGFNRQRFHEWSTVASEIQQQAFSTGIHPRQRAEELEVDRKNMKASMPQYAKILMSHYKDRRARFNPLAQPTQERYAHSAMPAPLPSGMEDKTLTQLTESEAQPDDRNHPQLPHDAAGWQNLATTMHQ